MFYNVSHIPTSCLYGGWAATLTVIAMDDLEVLHRSLRDAPVEVKYIRLCVIIPDWCLVLQLNDALCVLVLPAC